MAGETEAGGVEEWQSLAIVVAGVLFTLQIAWGLGGLLGVSMLATFDANLTHAAIGAAATLPLAALLLALMQSKAPALVRFRESQIDFFSEIGFAFTPPRIALLAIGAGLSEELLFRGVLQQWAAGHMPVAAAVLAPNIVFGALHARTLSYALIAGIVGVYFGVLMAATGNVLTPIVTHALYDAVALHYTQRAINARRKGDPSVPGIPP